MRFRNRFNPFKYDEKSLESKLLFYFKLYYFPVMISINVIKLVYLIYFENFTYNELLRLISLDIIIISLVYFIIKKIISVGINKIILDRIKLIKKDFEDIKIGNKIKKIQIKGVDEIDRIMYETNKIFDNLNNLLEIEKKNSLIDSLTKAYNRRALSINFKTLVEKLKRDGDVVSLLMFDIDNFKKINDTYGHEVGDKILKTLVESIRKTLRKYDTIYRIGGEEFVVIFPNLKYIDRKIILSRLRSEITDSIKKKVKEVEWPITVSGGFVSSKNFDLNDSKLLEKMLKIADDNLYSAKNSGKDKIIVSNPNK